MQRMSAAMAEQRKESGVQIMRMAGVSTVDRPCRLPFDSR